MVPLRLLVLLLLPTVVLSQLADDFEDGNPNGWSAEGDGDFSISQDIDPPNHTFLVADDATGLINYAIAPARYLGDYSAATAADSLRVSVYVASSSSNVTTLEDSPIYELVGPGGRARSEVGRSLPAGEWVRIAHSFNPDDWELVSGDWAALLADVQLLRIRAEYRNGNERVYLDSIALDLTPVRSDFTQQVCSDFTDGTLDGWRFTDVAATTVDTTAGNPGGALRVGDRPVVTSQATAPPKFLGDWRQLPDSSFLRFDLRIEAGSNPTIFDQPYLVRIAGAAGAALIDPAPDTLLPATTDWQTLRFPIEASAWTVTRGSWAELLAAVDTVQLIVEYVNGDEVVLLDNFCLEPGMLTSNTYAPVQDAYVSVFPNPAYGSLQIHSTQARLVSVTLFDLTGRQLLTERAAADVHQLHTTYRGAGVLRIVTTQGAVYRRVVLR